MTAGDDDTPVDPQARVVPFPFSRVMPAKDPQGSSDVTYGAFAEFFGPPQEQATGHWCSRCHKIWYGYLLEVACPTCGNRHG